MTGEGTGKIGVQSGAENVAIAKEAVVKGDEKDVKSIKQLRGKCLQWKFNLGSVVLSVVWFRLTLRVTQKDPWQLWAPYLAIWVRGMETEPINNFEINAALLVFL